VSAVIDYRGSGGDALMTALLLQPAERGAVVSVWRHAGRDWTLLWQLDEVVPLSANLRVAATANDVTLAINDRPVLSATAHELGVERCDNGLGIRWLGADVRTSQGAKQAGGAIHGV
jgi:hypothetical protein